MNGQHPYEALGAYVLGALDPGEAAEVRAHLAACAECARHESMLRPLPGLLDLAARVEVPPEPLPRRIEEAVLDRFAFERGTTPPPRRRRRLARVPRRAFAAAALAGGCAVAAVAVALALSGGDGGQGATNAGEQFASAGHGHGYGVKLRAAPAAPGAGANAWLEHGPGGTSVSLRVWGLPADERVVYEVRCERADDHWSAGAGTFRVDSNGRARVRLATAARGGEYDVIRVVRRTRRGPPAMVLSARLS